MTSVKGADALGKDRHRKPLAVLADYISLTKPRVIVLLLLTAIVPMFLALDEGPPLHRIALVMLGGYLAAGGAGAINCYLDRDLDAQMSRTCHRALPSGRLKPAHSLILGLVIGLLSGLVLWFGTHPMAAILALLALVHYVVVYTLWLKRRSSSNVIVGGLAGAVPPLVGWAAATGTLSVTALLLAALVFCWTPAHFWALALMRRHEYRRAGIPMLPVVRGQETTQRQILAYTLLTVLFSVILATTGMLSVLYTVAAVLLGGLFVLLAYWIRHHTRTQDIKKFYLYTLFYLAALFLAMLVDRQLLG